MSTYTQCRDAIVALLHGDIAVDYPTLPVFWENTVAVDLDKVGDKFVRIELEFDDAEQLTVNGSPWHRTYGTVYFTLMVKDGTGTRSVLELYEYFTNLVKFKGATHYQFEVVRPGKRDARDGWRSYELCAPFWFDVMQ